MNVVADVLPHIVALFSNPYMFSLLGLLAFALVVLAFKILCKN